jgi:hypothetical protein
LLVGCSKRKLNHALLASKSLEEYRYKKERYFTDLFKKEVEEEVCLRDNSVCTVWRGTRLGLQNQDIAPMQLRVHIPDF